MELRRGRGKRRITYIHFTCSGCLLAATRNSLGKGERGPERGRMRQQQLKAQTTRAQGAMRQRKNLVNQPLASFHPRLLPITIAILTQDRMDGEMASAET